MNDTINRAGNFYIWTNYKGVQYRYPTLERALFNQTLNTDNQHSKIQD